MARPQSEARGEGRLILLYHERLKVTVHVGGRLFEVEYVQVPHERIAADVRRRRLGWLRDIVRGQAHEPRQKRFVLRVVVAVGALCSVGVRSLPERIRSLCERIEGYCAGCVQEGRAEAQRAQRDSARRRACYRCDI